MSFEYGTFPTLSCTNPSCIQNGMFFFHIDVRRLNCIAHTSSFKTLNVNFFLARLDEIEKKHEQNGAVEI